ncbi:putative transferase CAF17 homolog, mitochondrial [Anopheles aquasalis]|uniref:putative transferase CAF17 homolog, mitochondrial n=1 Tax=Anopheles aquasalis TaxID=42839 RepID=UPI00215A8F52|nr:putative transferase CAF17 homolog, mitochondrial [Anopheles aquasalis]
MLITRWTCGLFRPATGVFRFDRSAPSVAKRTISCSSSIHGAAADDGSQSAQKPYSFEALSGRALVRVHGDDSISFLQGLMTNDMRHFEHGRAIYTMFLRVNGRVFCDALVYRHPEAKGNDDFLLECDRPVASRLEKHLKLYRLRKKVQVQLEETYHSWVAYREQIDPETKTLPTEERKAPTDPHLFKDPRLPRLDYRVLLAGGDDQTAKLDRLLEKIPGVIATVPRFVPFRYALGIGEGELNLPDGKAFPLESNCDWLHGVSFHKGCYIGQELTARTYHTGVTRKRLMPLQFEGLPLEDVPVDVLREADIKNEAGASVGKLRGYAAGRGLGLLRIEKVLPAGGPLTLTVPGITDSIVCHTSRPFWWPNDTNTRS